MHMKFRAGLAQSVQVRSLYVPAGSCSSAMVGAMRYDREIADGCTYPSVVPIEAWHGGDLWPKLRIEMKWSLTRGEEVESRPFAKNPCTKLDRLET
jgi:hypothetical protein